MKYLEQYLFFNAIGKNCNDIKGIKFQGRLPECWYSLRTQAQVVEVFQYRRQLDGADSQPPGGDAVRVLQPSAAGFSPAVS